jgi:hypothetical protein
MTCCDRYASQPMEKILILVCDLQTILKDSLYGLSEQTAHDNEILNVYVSDLPEHHQEDAQCRMYHVTVRAMEA